MRGGMFSSGMAQAGLTQPPSGEVLLGGAAAPASTSGAGAALGVVAGSGLLLGAAGVGAEALAEGAGSAS